MHLHTQYNSDDENRQKEEVWGQVLAHLLDMVSSELHPECNYTVYSHFMYQN